MASFRSIAGIAFVLLAVVLGGARWFLTQPIQSWHVPELRGKTFVVTGCTSGMGLETARMLGEWNATVIMANRNVEKSRRLAPARGVIEHHELDLASFASTRAFAKSLVASGRQLDGLILNAATQADGGETRDGVDMQYQVNHLSHFLLANLLLPAMKPQSRIVFVSSSMHTLGVIDKQAFSAQAKNVDPATRRSGMQLYSDTKLMITMTAVELDRRLKLSGRTGVTATSLHPGFVQTALDEEAGPLVRFLLPFVRTVLARDTPSGALTQLRVATDLALAGAGGRYFSDDCINSLCEGLQPAAAALDVAQRKWVWETSAEISGLAA